MADYQFLTYETLDDGKIARIFMNRPEARNAQNRGMLVELNEAFLRAEADDEVRVVIFGGVGPVFSAGHDLGSSQARSEREPGPDQHYTYQGYGGTKGRLGAADSAGVALLFGEHPALAQPAQDHHRPGTGHVPGGGADAGLVLRPDRGCRRNRVRRRGRSQAGHVRFGVLRPPVGVRARARPRNCC